MLDWDNAKLPKQFREEEMLVMWQGCFYCGLLLSMHELGAGSRESKDLLLLPADLANSNARHVHVRQASTSAEARKPASGTVAVDSVESKAQQQRSDTSDESQPDVPCHVLVDDATRMAIHRQVQVRQPFTINLLTFLRNGVSLRDHEDLDADP